jgi:hypothetical protein
MLRGVEHLEHRMSGGLALDPGLRKTSITLEAFCRLQEKGTARTMLVIAPLRVCRRVWQQEGAKWTQFRHLKFSLLHGPKKAQRLKDDADIWLINPEGVPWLCQLYFGRSLPFDVVTIDELTKFKNSGADRSKALRPRLAKVPRRWGLTGSLAPNGYMDLFGQMLMLDDGAALGRYITHYRDQYFQLDYDGFNYELLPGAESRIVKRIAPYWLQMSADDYMQLPPLIPDPIEIDMDSASRKTYDKMKRDMIAELPEGVVTAANTGAVYSKLAQMANGAVYVGDSHIVAHVHDAKLDALEELLEELNGAPLLLAYEFNHDLGRIRERFGKDLPYLGKGTTEKQEGEWMAAWNRGELPLFPCHPASAGHGLNLQEGNAAHVCWFSLTWDFELYDQFIRRVRRSGNTAQRIVNHILTVRGTIDELKAEALSDKDITQSRLLRALNAEIRRIGTDALTGGETTPADDGRKIPMVARLSRQADAAPPPAQQQAQGETRPVPKGWGKPAGAETAPAVDPGQRERIANQLTGAGEAAPPAAEAARAAFSPSVQAHMQELGAGDGAAKAPAPAAAETAPSAPSATRTRRSRAPAAQPEPEAVEQPAEAFLMSLRLECVKIAFSDPATTLEEGLEIASELVDFVVDGPNPVK